MSNYMIGDLSSISEIGLKLIPRDGHNFDTWWSETSEQANSQLTKLNEKFAKLTR